VAVEQLAVLLGDIGPSFWLEPIEAQIERETKFEIEAPFENNNSENSD